MNVMKKGVYYFDNKPPLVKPWNPEMEISTESVSSVPICEIFGPGYQVLGFN